MGFFFYFLYRIRVNAVLYITKTGRQWRMLPNDFPPYPTVWSFYRRANQEGLCDEILQALVKKRLSVGKEVTPTYVIIDSQSVKTTSKVEQKGIDGGKKIKGRKRHILVDTIGNLLGIVVHAVNIHDTKAGIMVVDKVLQIYSTIEAMSADTGYRNTFEQEVRDNHNIPVDISTKINGE